MNPAHRPVAIWLSATCVFILLMIMVGGITRLTDSGLSIVEWQPIMGAIPPLNEAEWLQAFEKYKQYPEYQLVKAGMSLDEFKFIFFWEYFHRLLGRLIGVVFFIPFMIFLVKGNLKTPGLKGKLFVGFVLGGLQGLMGWYMVKSGLVDRPDVSHYRLAAHFCLALLIIGYLFWIFMQLTDAQAERRSADKAMFKFSLAFFGLVGIQIVYGAFVAGLDAGIGYNTFPLMNGQFFPRQILFLEPAWMNFFDHPPGVQFVHRILGMLVGAAAIALVVFAWKRPLDVVQKRAFYLVGLLVMIQFTLGVMTLVMKVPLTLASMHQMGACLLLLSLLRAMYLVSVSRKVSTI